MNAAAAAAAAICPGAICPDHVKIQLHTLGGVGGDVFVGDVMIQASTRCTGRPGAPCPELVKFALRKNVD